MPEIRKEQINIYRQIIQFPKYMQSNKRCTNKDRTYWLDISENVDFINKII